MNIHGFITLTLLDYPEHLAASIFLGGCNLRCPFCQNGNLVLSPENEPSISEEEVLAFLKKRSGILEGVCISGGEPTLYRELPDFISKIKALGYLVKLDTNGTNPEMLRFLYENHLLDYIAMDIKTQPEQYVKVSGLQPDAAGTQKLLQNINLSKEYIMSCGIDYEFRTTVVRELHDEEDFREIGAWLSGCSRYYLQPYREAEHILASMQNPESCFHAPDTESLHRYIEILKKTIPNVELRGKDIK